VPPRVEGVDEEDVGDDYDGNPMPGLSQRNSHASNNSYSTLIGSCVFVAMLLGVVATAAFLKRRKKQNMMYGGRNVLTFANPNYNASEAAAAGGAAAVAADRRPFLWKKLKYEKAGGVAKAGGSALGGTRHDEGIILCAVPDLKTPCNLINDFDAVTSTTNVDDKLDDVYSEITVTEGGAAVA
jgi:hypothetical protein